MATERKNLPKINSPALPAAWPKLDKPDYGSKQHPDPDGSYKTGLVGRLDNPAVQALVRKLEPLHAAAVAEAEEQFKQLKIDSRKKLGKVSVNPLYETLYDKETEEPTGEVKFTFKRRASGTFKKGPKTGQKWSHKLAVFDSKGRLMAKVPEIWSGSIIKVQFTASPYFIPGTGVAGLKLGLEAAQLIDLIKGGERSAKDYGFGEEDGYEHDGSAEDTDTEGESFGGDETGSTETGSEDDGF
jgi:hypothetical protein